MLLKQWRDDANAASHTPPPGTGPAVSTRDTRLDVLRANVERTGLRMEITEGDARTWRPDQKVDAVLLDAPCSAMGVLRRHPEAAWRRDPASLAKYPKTQRALLDAAGEMLAPRGTLIYCVCTPFSEEGRDVVEGALKDGPWKRSPIQPEEVPGFVNALTPEGDLLTAPVARDSIASAPTQNAADAIDSDVFFVSRLEYAPI